MEKPETDHTTNNADIINQLAIVVKTGYFHDIENIAILKAIEKFIELINPIIEKDGSLRIDLIGAFFFINNTRVKHILEFILNFDYISKEFTRREIGSLIFLSPVSVNDIKVLIRVFINAGTSNSPFDMISLSLEGIDNIHIDKLKKIQEEEIIDRRRIAKRSYFNAVSFIKGIMKKLSAEEKVSTRQAKRVVESMVDVILSEDQLLIGMTAIKDYDEYTFHHSVNVSVLSIAIGHRIGLSRKSLTELGLIALFHDIGKMKIPAEVLNKPTAFTEEEWTIIKRHPYWGALVLLKLRGIEDLSIKSAIVAFMHHMHYDHSGYPKLKNPPPIDFYTKIINIADQYDAMTSSRVYSRTPLSPDRALSVMMERTGTQIDPILFKFFVNMVGVYPVGSLVLLDTREMGLVFECNHLVPDRPRVMVIIDGNGKKVDSFVVDLTGKDEKGRYARSIIKVLDPNKYKMNLAEYLL